MKRDIIDLRERGGKVVYWFCDLREPEPSDLGDLIDILFLSNSGQIEDFRNAYHIEKAYYMPQAYTPAFMHRLNLQEIWDIGFAGLLSSKLHSKRTKLLKKLSRKYKVTVRNDVRANIANFYSKSRIAFGMNPDSYKFLFTSNRFFIALGCEAFYCCEWFPGIDKLVRNHEHAIWFKTEKELFDLIDYYLENTEKREAVRKNAQALAHSKHTYSERIKNMLDIIDEKTDEFYGFL